MGKEEEMCAAVKQNIGNSDPLQWSKEFAAIAWRIHPASAVRDLETRAGSQRLSKEERKKAIVALAFIHTTESVESMFRLEKSSLADVKEHAGYWLNFRKSNDWFALHEWSKTEGEKDKGLSPNLEMERFLANLMDTKLPLNDRITAAQKMTKSAEGGKILVKLASDKKLSGEITRADQQLQKIQIALK